MGSIAEENSDVCIVTSDNPRSEDPQLIITNILEGMSQEHQTFVDREEAIARAIAIADPKKDVILVAGKGHEIYQEIRGTKYPFDDRQIASKYAPQGDENEI